MMIKMKIFIHMEYFYNYNFVSSYTEYERIKNVSVAEITNVSTNTCNTTIFPDDCSNKSFSRNYLIATKYLNLIKEHNPPVNIEHACKYLSYWVYQEMVKNSSSRYNVSTLLGKLMEAESLYICDEYTEDITSELFSKIQSLIALYKSLTEILISEKKDACQRNKICVKLYEDYKDTCDLNTDHHLCNEVENFRRTYNHLMYKTYKCNEFEYLPSYQKHDVIYSITTSIVALSAISFVSFISYKVNNYFI
ncbi:hypothetical protein PVBG_06285 [Plasmodium vivax Brazil I]|uniref:Variable surface protein n=1 Tax=Plasmodium vivax (strain Brazil I) TaxID=1033975 RepID=A0A0J9T1W9_PLAV1|nr:hypothetical protein PVBG_06285 [Plasmodium vivax Brazil I]